MTRRTSGAAALCAELQAAGVQHVFGLPGTQTVGLYEALRASEIFAVLPTHELSATFMAMGYAQASGRVGVVLAIPGPGFAYAVPGLAEAHLDGVAIVLITLAPARGANGEPGFQAIDQTAIVRPLVKAVVNAADRADLARAVRLALQTAREDNPGPVLLQISEPVLNASETADAPAIAMQAGAPSDGIDDLVRLVSAARRPAVLIAGASVEGSALRELAERGRMPVLMAAPSRGALPDDHPWSLCLDDQRTEIGTLNELLAVTDFVVVLGSRLGHVSTAGFQLKFRWESAVSVAEGGGNARRDYRPTRSMLARPDDVVHRLVRTADGFASTWTAAEVGGWRERFAHTPPQNLPEPVIDGKTPRAFFSALRSALPRDAMVITDSGLHQLMARRHYPVFAPGGLLFPSDFQSMGFGLPAAIGAKLARPDRPVVALVGDGGFAMTGMELLAAAKAGVSVVVVVLNDGQLNLIRLQQFREFGRSHAVALKGPDFEALAGAVGASYYRTQGNPSDVMRVALASQRPSLIEVPVTDSIAIRGLRARNAVRESARSIGGPDLVDWVKHRLRGA